MKKIYLACPRGFCAGVSRAIAILDYVLEKFGPPIYVKHEIVHNRIIVTDYEKKGVIFKENIEDIPDKAKVVLSAHGTPPPAYEEAKNKNLVIFDATCPLVTKVHLEAKRYVREGYFVLYIGHRNHQEAIGVLGEIPDGSATLISSVEEAKSIYPPQKDRIIVLNQTTLSFDDTLEIINILKKRFPKIILPPSSDICYSTQNRQNAVKKLAEKTKTILVIGSKGSSNSNRLKEVAQKQGAKAYLIDSPEDIKAEWLKNIDNVGVAAGASVPDYIITSVIDYLKTKETAVEEVISVRENIRFPFDLKLIQK